MGHQGSRPSPRGDRDPPTTVSDDGLPMSETLETGGGPACGEKVCSRDRGVIRSTGQRPWYPRDGEEESGKEMGKSRQKQGTDSQGDRVRIRGIQWDRNRRTYMVIKR